MSSTRLAILGAVAIAVGCGGTRREDSPIPAVAKALSARPALAVSGHVRGADGAPVAGAHVALTAGAGLEAHAVTDAAGAYVLGAPRAGSWSVSAHAPGHVASFLGDVGVSRSGASNVDLALGKLGPEGVEIAVRVQHTDPLPAGAALMISRESDDRGDTWFAPIDPATDIATAIVPAGAKHYFVETVAPLGGRLTIDDPAHVPAFAVVVHRPPPEPVVAYVRDHAARIASVDPARTDFSDLAGFGALVGNVKVIGIGEATHGTREFFQLKHRLFMYLAIHKGFTTFAFEADQAECRAIERFIQHAAPAGVTAKSLVNAIALPVWKTEEIAALVQWMHDYNATAATRLHFVGFDFQSWPAARAELGAFLERVDAAAAKALATATAKLDEKRIDRYDPGDVFAELPKPAQEAIGRALASAERTVEARRTEPGADMALRNVASLRQWLAYNLEPTDPVRDRVMAENLVALRKPDTKLMIWAHNYHVGRYAETQSMGTHLAKAWGDDYLAFGVVFGGGNFIARTLRETGNPDAGYTALVEQTLGPAPPTDAAAPFLATGVPILALDLRALPAPAAAWFDAPHPTRELGWLFISELAHTRDGVLTARFDAALFVARSTSARLLP